MVVEDNLGNSMLWWKTWTLIWYLSTTNINNKSLDKWFLIIMNLPSGCWDCDSQDLGLTGSESESLHSETARALSTCQWSHWQASAWWVSHSGCESGNLTWARNFKLAATVTVSLSDQAQAAASHGDHDCQAPGHLDSTVTDSSHCDCPGRS